jgi:hypothetical protein
MCAMGPNSSALSSIINVEHGQSEVIGCNSAYGISYSNRKSLTTLPRNPAVYIEYLSDKRFTNSTGGGGWKREKSYARNILHFNLLKPTGYVMHQQFNIQQLYALPTLYLCVLYLPENKQRLVPLTA